MRLLTGGRWVAVIKLLTVVLLSSSAKGKDYVAMQSYDAVEDDELSFAQVS